MSLSDEIKKLQELRESGILNEQEFSKAKERILAGGLPGATANHVLRTANRVRTATSGATRIVLGSAISRLKNVSKLRAVFIDSRYSDSERPPAPPILPALTGTAAFVFGIINSLMVLPFIMATLVLHPEERPGVTLPVASMGLLGACYLLTILAGVGIILHRSWGKTLVSGMVFGSVIVSGLCVIPIVVGLRPSPGTPPGGAYVWCFITGVIWAVASNLMFRIPIMKIVFPK